MKRLVYSPSVKVWVKADAGVVDLSPYVTECKIDRKVDDTSVAEIIFRNPKILQDGKPRFLFTQTMQENGELGPVFHPMDPITIVLERIQGKPIQVFTGYCDAVPYVQLFPGVTRITASCTLKRLMYTFWDPALPFVTEFMREYGWELGSDGMARQGGSGNPDQPDQTEDAQRLSQTVGSTNLNDGSIGRLLYAVLNEVGGWDSKNIYIQPLPSNISTIVQKLFDEFTEDNKDSYKEVGDFLKQIIGNGQFGNAITGTTVTNNGQTGGNGVTIVGDSITNASRSQLESALPGIQIYAQDSKHMEMNVANNPSGLKILNDNKDTLRTVVVVALGSNDESASVSEFSQWIDTALGHIGTNRKAIFVTVTNNDNVNTAIRNKKSENSNMYIADWKSKAQLSSDGLHPTENGKTVFAQTIADVVTEIMPSDAGGVLGVDLNLPNPPANFLSNLEPGIRKVAYKVLQQFPSLSVSSSLRPGDSRSLHSQGRAVDLSGSSDLMQEASEWIKTNLGKNLEEGIHKPNLSIDGKNTVPSSFWGSDTWNDHADHIHLAV